MRYLLVGLGNLGQKRRAVLGDRCVATADPFNPAADHRSPDAVPLDSYDAAVLSVPNEPKLDLIEYFLRHGKHVLVEKPVLFNGSQAARIDAAARAGGAVWYTAYNHRFEPLIVELKRRLDAGFLGDLYHGRLHYGNGTVGNVVGSWREGGLGVVEDLGSHLLDLTAHLFERRDDFSPCALNRHESSAYDQAMLISSDRRLVLETSYVSWKNDFHIELYGSKGSAHLHGLRKWGPCQLILRERVLPSGVPLETWLNDAGSDQTWARDVEYFEQRVRLGETSAVNDGWISRVLSGVPR